MTLITPSGWLRDMVKESFLAEYPVEVKYNTINTDVFKPTESSFRQEHGLQDKKIVLGVASIWNERKGLGDFIELSKRLDPEKYQVVLVGLNEDQLKDLKDKSCNIVALPRTSNAGELVKIYSAADVFVNPTYEDTFPSVNMEAEACGTRVITYDTGGCRETINRPDSVCIERNVDAIVAEVLK